jgi:hypothetical protein
MTVAPAVAIVPYAERLPEGLANLPLDRLDWPLGRPDRLRQGTVADMAPTDHLVTYPKTRLYLAPRGRRRAQLSLMIVEPDVVHAKHLRLARLFHRRFVRVLTKNDALLAAIPNGLHLPFGSTFLTDPAGVDCRKTQMASLIASAKQVLPGHRLRHRIVAAVRDRGLPVEVMGRGYRPFDDKAEGLAPFRYSVVIENVRETSYFTEKLVDALLCRTVPIYWGAPDIARNFDPQGLIACDSAEDILAALATMSPQDYDHRRPAIEENRLRALDFADLHGRAARAVLAAAAAAWR